MKRIALIATILLLTAWTHGNGGAAIYLLNNSSVILTNDASVRLLAK